MSRNIRGWLTGSGIAAFLIVFTACASSTSTQPETERAKLKVVATTALLADMVRSVGGDLVEVIPIVPPGADAHSFQPLPSDSVAVNNAALVVSNGGDFDEFLKGMLEGALGEDTVHVVASEGLAELNSGDAGDAGDNGEAGDPHFWQNPMNVMHYARRFRDGLSAADPENAAAYAAGTEDYIEELKELDREISRTLDAVPTERRHIFSFHDAFGHFADRYGWTVSALVHSDASDVTPTDIVELIQSAADERVTAVFAEPQFGSRILETAAKEAGVKVGVIYSDALDDEVSSYADMMRFNSRSLAEHLK